MALHILNNYMLVMIATASGQRDLLMPVETEAQKPPKSLSAITKLRLFFSNPTKTINQWHSSQNFKLQN